MSSEEELPNEEFEGLIEMTRDTRGETLDWSHEPLGRASESVIQALCAAAADLHIKTALLVDCGLYSDGYNGAMSHIFKFLQSKREITTLDLSDNPDLVDCVGLRAVLAACSSLTALDLSDTYLRWNESLIGALPANLMTLNLIDTYISNIKALPRNLESLNLAGGYIRQIDALPRNLVSLNLAHTDSNTDDIMPSLCRAMETHTALTNLDLSRSRMESAANRTMELFGKAIAANTTITSLNLSNNFRARTREALLAPLCTGLSSNSTIIELDLSGNDLHRMDRRSAPKLEQLWRESLPGKAQLEANRRGWCLLFCCMWLQERMVARLNPAPPATPNARTSRVRREQVTLGALPAHVLQPAVVAAAELTVSRSFVGNLERAEYALRQVFETHAASRAFFDTEMTSLERENAHLLTKRPASASNMHPRVFDGR